MTRSISGETLAKAVSSGLIDARVRDRLVAMEAEGAGANRSIRSTIYPDRQLPDPENPRFIGGFGDVFIAIGIVIFLGAAGTVVGGASESLFLTALVIAGLSWGLAELFTLRRRAAFPSFILLLTFVGSVLAFVAGVTEGGSGALDNFQPAFFGATWTERLLLVLAAFEPVTLITVVIAGLGAAWLHYRRFGVPITIAACAVTVIAAVIGLLARAAPETTLAAITPIAFFSGLGLFAAAMAYDLSDPARATRRSDIAFWLHLVAAPLMVRAVLPVGPMGTGEAVAVLLAFCFIALVAMVIDRRAPLVAGLVSFGFAVAAIVTPAMEGQTTLTFLLLGALVLAIAYAWQPIRQAVLGMLPPALAERLPRSLEDRPIG